MPQPADRRAGARDTIWLVPGELDQQRAFQSAVSHGAMYLNVVDRENSFARLTPWEHHEQNKDAVLHVSGSIVAYDNELRRLTQGPTGGCEHRRART